MSTLVIITVICCAVIAYFAWRQQQGTLEGVKALQASGVVSDVIVYSRPLILIDKEKGYLYLVKDEDINSVESIALSSIKKITFIETPSSNNNNTDPKGPDSIQIETENGNMHRVGDLPDSSSGATNAKQFFEKHNVLANKLVLKRR